MTLYTELEPRRQRDGDVEMFLDLGATNEDHGEVGFLILALYRHRRLTVSVTKAWNEKDITMQAGKQRGALPLIRKFNEHSERLLKSAMYAFSRHRLPSIFISFAGRKVLRQKEDE